MEETNSQKSTPLFYVVGCIRASARPQRRDLVIRNNRDDKKELQRSRIKSLNKALPIPKQLTHNLKSTEKDLFCPKIGKKLSS